MKRILLFVIAISLTSIASAEWKCSDFPMDMLGCDLCSNAVGVNGRVCEDLVSQDQSVKRCCWKGRNIYTKYGCTTNYMTKPGLFPAKCAEIVEPYLNGGQGGKGGAKENAKGTPKNTPKTTTPVKTNVVPAKVTGPVKTAAPVKAAPAVNSKQVAR